MNCFQDLLNGVPNGIQANKNLTVYTSLPNEDIIRNAGQILKTLISNYSIVLIDCDFQTPISYFSYAQEVYLVQSMDVLTIQPLTAFLNMLRSKNVLDESKLRIVLNKVEKLRRVDDKVIIGGMSSYNDPAMTYMVNLFDKNVIRYISIPFDEQVYVKYLEGLIDCEISLKGYPKNIIQVFTELANMLYSSTMGKTTYRPPTANGTGFSPSINSTLEQMRKILVMGRKNIVLMGIVAVLIIVIVGLIIYNLSIHKKIQTFRNINQKITNLSVVQDFMNAIGETSSVDDKIKKINDILIQKYEIKYSTIVVFNGAEYIVKASNVDKRHWDSLSSLQDIDMFKDSISTATPKYVTVNSEKERLPYQQMEFGRAKSAIFFPFIY